MPTVHKLGAYCSASPHWSALVSRESVAPSSSAWAIQFRRHDSLIESCLATAAIG